MAAHPFPFYGALNRQNLKYVRSVSSSVNVSNQLGQYARRLGKGLPSRRTCRFLHISEVMSITSTHKGMARLSWFGYIKERKSLSVSIALIARYGRFHCFMLISRCGKGCLMDAIVWHIDWLLSGGPEKQFIHLRTSSDPWTSSRITSYRRNKRSSAVAERLRGASCH